MFAHPLMLAWVAAAAVPLVLRLLARSADRTVQFSAVLFLPGGTAAAAADGGRTRGWLLLLLRSAALGLLAVALARPVLPASSRWASVPTDGLTSTDHLTVALVVDDAAGTGYVRHGASRFEAVTGVALDLLAHLRPGDRACVVADPPPTGWADGRPSADLSAAATAVSSLHVTHRPADVADALRRAAHLLADVTGPRLIVVCCDREAAGWRNVTEPFGQRWRLGEDGRPPPRVVVVPVGGEEADNVAVTSVRLLDPPLVRGMTGTARVTVRNLGPEPRADVPLQVWTGNRSLADTAVSLPAAGTVTLDVPVKFGDDGPKLVSAAVLRTGGVAFDDRRDGVADVVSPARVLLVTDDPPRSFPLWAALAPNAAAGRGGGGGDPADVTVVTGPAWTGPSWTGVDRKRYDAVVLADVAVVSADRAADLRRFVDDGGGLLVAPGGRVSAADYDDVLGDDGVGLLPADLTVTHPTARGGGVRLTDVNHLLLTFANGGPDPADGLHFTRSFRLAGRPTGRVMMTVDGRPMLVAAEPPGGGRVVLLTVPLDDSWGPFTGSGLYPPLVRSIARWLAQGRADDHEVVLGRPIVVPVDGSVAARSASVQQPAGRREPAQVVPRGKWTDLRYGRATIPGTYTVRYRANGRAHTTYAVVVGPPEASDLTPLSPADWDRVRRTVGFDPAPPTPTAVAAAVTSGRGGPEGWAAGIGGVLLLLVAEAALGRRWSAAAGRSAEQVGGWSNRA